MLVAVCVITYHRPLGLRRLLEGLERLRFEQDVPKIQIIVVDNDEEATARHVCDDFRSRLKWPIEYAIEARRGIPFARNKAIALAMTDSDLIAFIDDDEVLEPNWLAELLRVMGEHEADVVAGPVVPCFEAAPPHWVIKGRFHDRRRWQTGQRLDRAFTNNILLRRSVFETMEKHFDERMAMTGGSDSHFLQRVNRAGHSIVWADDAVVTEWNPASRMSAKWILRRAYRVGTTMAFIYRDLHSGLLSLIVLPLGGGIRCLRGTLMLPLALISGRRGLVQAFRHFCTGIGMLAGFFGATFREYDRVHGS